jgi:hypothetical protein
MQIFALLAGRNDLAVLGERDAGLRKGHAPRSGATGVAGLKKVNNGPSANHGSQITEPEKTVLRCATSLARELAPPGCIRGCTC